MYKNLHDELSRLSDTLYSTGQPTDYGCKESDVEDMIKRSQEIDPNKPYCVVASWCIWDIQLSKEGSGEEGDIFLVKAERILDDEFGRFPPFGWVRSTAVLTIKNNCIFTTRNTHYILVGSGTRKAVSAEDALRYI